jgi:hypothetical protein
MQNERTTRNYEGDLAFKLSPDMELYARACATALGGEFYTPDSNDLMNRIKTLVRMNDPLFVAQLATYIREEQNLRAIPLVLAVELAKTHSGDDLVRRMARRVISRADELARILVYYARANKKNWYTNSNGQLKMFGKLSNQLRKGVSDSFLKFDEYQLNKYDRTYLINDNRKNPINNSIKLRDVLFLTHPKPMNNDQEELFRKLAQDELAKADTWEKRMTEGGGKSKKETWEGLIAEKRMGYMACLKNLRNFIQEDVSPEHIEMVARYLENPKAVRNSKQLPFRFLAAYRALGHNGSYARHWYVSEHDASSVDTRDPRVRRLARALETAVLTSIENIPMFADEKVLIAADVSGSMQVPATGTRDEHRAVQMGKRQILVERFDIAILLSMLLLNRCEMAAVGMFGDTFKTMSNLSRTNILENTNKMHEREGEVGYATNGYKVLEWALKVAGKTGGFDRIMLFTDGQMWDTHGRVGRMEKLWRQYKSQVPQCKLYLFNLASYGTTPVDLQGGDVYMISGWSEKVFEVLKNIEQGEEALETIRSIEL